MEKRVARMQWIAANPMKAFRHLARAARGLLRVRLSGMAAPPSFAPPVVACAALAAGVDGVALAPDT